jgi:heme A synthase
MKQSLSPKIKTILPFAALLMILLAGFGLLYLMTGNPRPAVNSIAGVWDLREFDKPTCGASIY